MIQYLTEAPKPTDAQLRQIERLRNDARDARQRAEDSFQRCDTDGFLSQWANSIGAQKDAANVRILENGGYARFPVLCDADGSVVATRIYEFENRFASWKTDRSWKVLPEYEERVGRRWVPIERQRRSRVQEQLGVHEEDRWFPAVAIITTGSAKSTGLAGCANAYVAVVQRSEADPRYQREVPMEAA